MVSMRTEIESPSPPTPGYLYDPCDAVTFFLQDLFSSVQASESTLRLRLRVQDLGGLG